MDSWTLREGSISLASFLPNILEEDQLSRILVELWELGWSPLPHLRRSMGCHHSVQIPVIEAGCVHLAFEKELGGSS
jgi:hypothetical protein